MENNNIQKHNHNKDDMAIISKISLLIFFTIALNVDFNSSEIAWWGSFVFVIAGLFIHILKNGFIIKKYSFKYIVWSMIFIGFSVFSVSWALQPQFSIEVIKKMIIRSLVLWCISIMCTKKKNFITILKLFIIASLINEAYIFSVIDIKTIGSMRIGAGSLGEKWNANDIGMIMSFAAFMATFLYRYEQKKSKKYVYLIAIILLGVIVVFTGSKKAVFIFSFASLLFYYITSKNKLGAMVIVLLGAIITIYLIMNVPVLYNIMGERIEKLFFYFTGNGSTDNSTMLRIQMIEDGFSWFKDKFIIGYGINNYNELYGSMTGWYTYSHNNYIELLIDLGIVGCIIYYFSYIYILKNTLKRTKQLFSAFSCSAVITILISELGLVSYDVLYVQLLICLGFAAISIDIQEENTCEEGSKVN
ncbi:O-antigen ligase family protein [Clostridium botulinum]|uniref:O-antigen ligase-related domain-containing protein n=1 Tax=Clostridium botulinum TaxID=1491 RepID=A0A9Q1ZC32_CLOBO|nr:O-antigen ligase family protein [Clostridium botulinum]AEB75392.1 hypothetical protein CbC4_0712 [Clostridium botulinum BKT015925]KEH99909.1 hypothetical protein Z953_10665 [Clostridium botulinum D str. 16868]KEI03771.1 hypothetical protein Y848_04415 [Clostridium botulinum C/D str. Sp77]KLU76357.1 hypothetical protein CBC3_03910 [Clostridium botulinum V891]KOA73639.1 hypothetical protein ADU78_12010 [Clostridium botulinum]